jgi:hypothetical protein
MTNPSAGPGQAQLLKFHFGKLRCWARVSLILSASPAGELCAGAGRPPVTGCNSPTQQ